MNLERWHQIEQLFHSAREMPHSERDAFLTRACSGDAELRDEIGSLLRESDEAEDFLTDSALALGLSFLAPCQNRLR